MVTLDSSSAKELMDKNKSVDKLKGLPPSIASILMTNRKMGVHGGTVQVLGDRKVSESICL